MKQSVLAFVGALLELRGVFYNASMSTPILATKLYLPPPRSKVVLRPRLIERLNEGLSAGRPPGVTLVSAPAGFGKTTLISEWVSARLKDEGGGMKEEDNLHPSTVAWLSLDEGDNDPSRFLTYLISAMQTIVPKIGERLLGGLQSPQPPPIETILTTLLNEITTIADNFILVLDDYHVVDSQPVDQALVFLVEHLPPQMQLVIASREDPPLPLARLRVRGQLTELRATDLRFTPAEAAEFLNRVMGLTLSAEAIAALEQRTEGWIAGLQLAALALSGTTATPGQGETTRFIESFTGSHHFVLDYLLEEVLQKQPETIQSFLLSTAILDRLCGPLCDAIVLDPGVPGQATLEYLEHANLFIVPLDNERQWYRYHRLFADLLRQRLRQAILDVAAHHLRASQWYDANGYMTEAFHHAIAAKDLARAADVAERAWPSMEGTFQTAAWLGWIKQLPEEVIRTRPLLGMQIGRAFSDAGEPETSERYLQDAERGLIDAADLAAFKPLPGTIALIRAYNAQVQGNVADTLKYAELAAQLIPEDDIYRRAQAAITLNFTHWVTGNLEAARRALEDWMTSMTRLGNHVFVVASAFAVADILIEQGRLREARQTYEQALQLAAKAGPEAEAITAHHQLGLALLQHELDNAEAFVQHWQQAADLGRQTTLVDWPYRWQVAQARVKASMGDFDVALDLLDEAQRVYVKNPVPDLRPVAALKTQVYLRQGRLSQAQAWVCECGLSVDDEPSYLHEFEYLTLARVLLAEPGVNALLTRLLRAAEAQNRTGSMLEILVTQALASRAQGNTPAALATLEHALTLAEPEGYVRIFVDEGEPMRLLLERMKAEGGKMKEYIHRLLAASGARQDIHPSSFIPQPLLVPLSPRELEVLRLIAQGLSNQEIADRLFLAVSTVKGYTRTIFDKLQVQRRTEAVARARELGLL